MGASIGSHRGNTHLHTTGDKGHKGEPVATSADTKSTVNAVKATRQAQCMCVQGGSGAGGLGA